MCTNDIDNDGDLDIYVTQIMKDQPSINGRNAAPNKLIINDNNTFKMISIPTIESTGVWLACSIIDINHDGLKDIIVINDFGKDELFIQKNHLVFIDKARHYKFDDAGSGMNLSIIDFNGDEFWDIYITMIDLSDVCSLKGEDLTDYFLKYKGDVKTLVQRAMGAKVWRT